MQRRPRPQRPQPELGLPIVSSCPPLCLRFSRPWLLGACTACGWRAGREAPCDDHQQPVGVRRGPCHGLPGPHAFLFSRDVLFQRDGEQVCRRRIKERIEERIERIDFKNRCLFLYESITYETDPSPKQPDPSVRQPGFDEPPVSQTART